jgi:single-strand DNA-binding protein
MEKSVNKVELCGFAGSDAEVKTLKSGASVAKFSLATSRNYKNKEGEWVRDTTWHNIVLWDKQAEEAGGKIKKGIMVNLDGRIECRQFTDNNGEKRTLTEIRALNFDVLENSKQAS